MRALEVLGLDADGVHLLCQDPSSGEEFSLPCDERLRAAVRGDLSRLGQLQIEMESQLRPKEIQARIRAGATVEEVAAAAGTSPSRIDRFAYPVLMERSTMAERAQVARPVGAAGPAAHSIAEIVADTLATRGIPAEPVWDAYKDSRGWVLVVSWQAGRSENTARFDLHLGSNGGTVVPRDDAAGDLLDPAPKPLRLSSVAQLTERPAPKAGKRAMASLLEQPAAVPTAPAQDAARPEPAVPTGRAERRPARTPEPTKPETATVSRGNADSGKADSAKAGSAAEANSGHQADATSSEAARSESVPEPAVTERVAPERVAPERVAAEPVATPQRPADRRAEQAVRAEVSHPKPAPREPEDVVADTVQDDRSAAAGVEEQPEPMQAQAHTGTDGAPARQGGRKSGRSKPAMPSWDDVLLGGSKRR